MDYRLLPEARRELRDAARRRSPGAGSLERTTASGAEIRSFRLERFEKHAILIAVLDGVPTVLAFKHSSRRQGYWGKRLG